MTTDRDLEEMLRQSLADEAPRMSSDLRTAVRREIAVTQQVGSGAADFQTRLRGRSPSAAMLAAAAVVVVAIAGLAVIDRLQLLGPGGTPAPSMSASSAGPSSTPLPPPTAAPSPTPSAPADPFSGRWSTLDIDGSQMTIVFDGGGASRSVAWSDFRATYCAGDRQVAEGSGTLDGASIHVTMTGACAGKPGGAPIEITYTFDAASGTLQSGNDNLTWARGSIPLDAFTGPWAATDIDSTALRLTFSGTDGLERDVAYHDKHAQFCTAEPGYSAVGTGTIGSVPGFGRYIRVTLDGSCDDRTSPRHWEHTYEFDVTTGTLIGPLIPLDLGGTRGIETVVWSRP